MKGLLIGLTLLASLSSFASEKDCDLYLDAKLNGIKLGDVVENDLQKYDIPFAMSPIQVFHSYSYNVEGESTNSDLSLLSISQLNGNEPIKVSSDYTQLLIVIIRGKIHGNKRFDFSIKDPKSSIGDVVANLTSQTSELGYSDTYVFNPISCLFRR